MTVNDNSTKSINAAIIDLQNQIKQLQHKIDILSKNQLKEEDIEFPGKVKYADEAGKAKEADHAKTADTAKYTSETENAVHAGTADNANAPTGFTKGSVDTWGNQDGEFITDWVTVKGNDNDNHGDIAFRFNNGQVNVKIDGVFYQNEGRYKLVDENSIKAIMKPNYTTGRFPAGKYGGGETVTISTTITTTRGNPVFISYSGDFNSTNNGNTVPWVSFNMYADGKLIQCTVVDNSSAISSDNTSFAGSALAVLSAGSHTIRLDAVLTGSGSGQIEFQEQENYVNLVAFEL